MIESSTTLSNLDQCRYCRDFDLEKEKGVGMYFVRVERMNKLGACYFCDWPYNSKSGASTAS